MDKDFHFYGTYVAARWAGFNGEDARVIAYAAQFVDDCTDASKSIQTCETTMDSILSYLRAYEPITNEEELRLMKIWTPFHFLPGNLEGDIKYEGKEAEKKEDRDHGQMGIRCICLPNSELSRRMVSNLNKKCESRKDLIRLGVIMHVLADTYAHMFFSGMPEYYANNVLDSIMPGSVRWRSPVYLGHAQVFHSPDIANKTFEYKPVWLGNQDLKAVVQKYNIPGITIKDGKIHRNNPEIFYSAFMDMYEVMKNACKSPSISQPDKAEIMGLLHTRDESNENDQTEAWKKYIVNHAAYTNSQPIPVYDINEWKVGKDGELDNFFDVVKEHQQMVLEYIDSKGFSI